MKWVKQFSGNFVEFLNSIEYKSLASYIWHSNLFFSNLNTKWLFYFEQNNSNISCFSRIATLDVNGSCLMLPTQPACKCSKLTLETLELKPEIKPEYYQVTNVLKHRSIQ